MSSGGGGHIILANAKITFQDEAVRAVIPHRFLKIIDPIIAKDYEDWSDKDRFVIFGVLTWASVSVPIS